MLRTLLDLHFLADSLSGHTDLKEHTQGPFVAVRGADFALDVLLSGAIDDGLADIRLRFLSRIASVHDDNHLVACWFVDASAVVMDDGLHV